MMPSTSVQIQSSDASKADARMDAEKSDPPRPRVVGRPLAVAPLKPVMTGITPCFSIGSSKATHRSRVASIRGDAFPKTASVTMTLDALVAAARIPSDSKYAASSTADSRSPMAMASSIDRGGRSPSMRTPLAMRPNSLSSMSTSPRTATRGAPSGNSSLQAAV